MNYTVHMGRTAIAALYKIERGKVASVTDAIAYLGRNPRPPLSQAVEDKPGTYTIKAEGFTIAYEVNDQKREVLVIYIGN